MHGVVDDLIFKVTDDKVPEDTLLSKLREAASYENTYTQGDLNDFAYEAYQREGGGLNENYKQLITRLEPQQHKASRLRSKLG